MTRHLSHIGRDLHTRLRTLFAAPLDASAAPLEIAQAVLDDVERRVEPVGGGRRVFPYSRILVRIGQTRADRTAIEAAFAGFDKRVRERLGELRCELPGACEVTVSVLKKPPADWAPNQLFSVDYRGDPDPQGISPLHITIVKGAAARKGYSFTEPVISIGRTADPTDAAGRVRRNRVAFLDTIDGVTETVGRAHAQLRFDPQSRGYRLFDDGSSNGTSILRDGSAILVPPRDPRGVRVRSGDEIQVGRAIIRVVYAENGK